MVGILKLVRFPPALLTSFVALVPIFAVKIAWYQQFADFLFTASFLYVDDPFAPEVYDFIIVGGGSAGSVLAARLSENFKILLLEAGGDPHPLSYIPSANPFLLNEPIMDWQYKTEPLNNSGFAFSEQRMIWPRARALGGCSNNNWMQYNRGNPNDFDNWANITDDDRWSYKNVLKYFRRQEDYHGHWKGSEQFHGYGGPMYIEGITHKPSLKYWLTAAEELGFQTTTDPNAVQTQGFGPFDVTQKRGIRYSTYRGYIVPNLLNKNLKIRRYSYATKIHFDDSMQTTGVSYLHHGVPKYATVSKELIVSGGAINTAQLLMLSGIGPKDHLKDVGVKPLVDLPVGENLQDHVSAFASFQMDSSLSFILERDGSAQNILDYVVSGTGPFTANVGLGGYGLYATKRVSPEWPDIFYILTPLGNFQDYGKAQDILSKGAYDFNFWERWMKPTEGTDTHLIYVLLGRPKSRGFIKLADANPMSKPIIQPAYFSDPGGEDMETLIDGLELLERMYERTTAFQVAGARMNPVPMPGCENFIFKSRRYYECVVRTHPQTIYHPSCTTPMGKPGDPRAVLDSELRVVGVKGLRVADTSVMPVITNANLNAPTIMIGERCADLIKSTWLPQPPIFLPPKPTEAALMIFITFLKSYDLP